MPDVFRRREGEVWHSCFNCPEWPREGEFEEARGFPNQDTKPEDFCEVCRQLIRNKDCSYVGHSTPDERAAKDRKAEGFKRHRLYGGGSW